MKRSKRPEDLAWVNPPIDPSDARSEAETKPAGHSWGTWLALFVFAVWWTAMVYYATGPTP